MTREIPFDTIVADGRYQYFFDPDRVAVQSRAAEILQGRPAVLFLRQLCADSHQLVACYREYAALAFLKDVGHEVDPVAKVYSAQTSTSALLKGLFSAAIEHGELSPMDLGAAAEKLARVDGLLYREVAELLQLPSEKVVQRLIRLARAPEELRLAVHRAQLSPTQAQMILKARTDGHRTRLLRRILSDLAADPPRTWPVRRIEKAVRNGWS